MAKGKKLIQPQQNPIEKDTIVEGSDNVFADLGLPDAEGLLFKGKLTLQLHHRIQSLGLTQTQAAKQLGISQPEVCRLLKGRFTGFSAERLIALLNALEMDVEIVVRPRPPKQVPSRGQVQVVGVAT
jgi:predicted XRE-type DNA-binding protein